MGDGQRDYSAADSALIERESRNLERQRAKVEASVKSTTETISNFLKQDALRRSIATDLMNATKDSSRQNTLFSEAVAGSFKQGGEVITGMEDRPWENN